jgi:AcrR family transcriptional regulator
VTSAASDAPERAPRPMRADARRNHDKILATARVVFAERGTDASLDEIARRAEVGPGTLYRHFPTRDALVDALMQDWTDRVTADAEDAIATGAPAPAMLLDWFGHFVEHITLHRGAAGKICAAMDDPASPMYRKCRVMGEANRRVLDHLDARGELRPGVDAATVMRLVSGVASVADTSRAAVEVGPMLEVVVDGIVRG